MWVFKFRSTQWHSVDQSGCFIRILVKKKGEEKKITVMKKMRLLIVVLICLTLIYQVPNSQSLDFQGLNLNKGKILFIY